MYKFLDERGQHVHTLDDQPLFGTSTVIKDVMPPFLARWGAQCAVDHLKATGEEAAAGKLWYCSIEDFDKAVLAWSKVRDTAASKGTDLHAELERYVKHCIEKHGGSPREVIMPGDPENEKKIREFSKWAVEFVDQFIASEVNVYSREAWVGGIIDCVARLKTGELAIIDFKSSKEAYFNHFVQVGGYALQIEENGAFLADGTRALWETGRKEFGGIQTLIVVPFGGKTLVPVQVQNVQGFKEAFQHCVEIYKLMQAFKKR